MTTSAQPDWNQLTTIMAPGATIHPISVSGGDFSIPYSKSCHSHLAMSLRALTNSAVPLILNGLRVQGSVVASRYIQNRMLAFAALHNIKPIIEKFPMTEKGIEEGMDKLDQGEMRYRGVMISA